MKQFTLDEAKAEKKYVSHKDWIAIVKILYLRLECNAASIGYSIGTTADFEILLDKSPEKSVFEYASTKENDRAFEVRFFTDIMVFLHFVSLNFCFNHYTMDY